MTRSELISNKQRNDDQLEESDLITLAKPAAVHALSKALFYPLGTMEPEKKMYVYRNNEIMTSLNDWVSSAITEARKKTEMPKKNEKSTNKASWSIKTMKAGLKAVTSGKSIRKSAARFDIPFSKLEDRVKAGKCYGPSLEKKCVFREDEKKEIKQHVVLLSKLYFGLTVMGLRRLAFEVSTIEKAAKGFERSGIWPLNLETFGEKDFLSSGNLRLTIIANEEPAIRISVASDEEDAATSSLAPPSASNTTSANLSSPIPATLYDKNPLTKRRKTAKQRSEILTVTLIKGRLEEAERHRSLKLSNTLKTSREPFKRKQIKKALFDNASSDRENHDVCDNDFFFCTGETNITKEVCSLCNEFGRDNELWFRCVLCSG
ncbi:hypothetical protein ILUMI_25126 [Ignelater luminosus]|uniref:HTH psq-type domain-containing protein n=1 Tax=Ignelater luminosus TaxID=2038154 RepID=A0A8K0C5X9_IGNLU|nr:hypothetical protein ILUMI_25126 [Ignelater luminosus]